MSINLSPGLVLVDARPASVPSPHLKAWRSKCYSGGVDPLLVSQWRRMMVVCFNDRHPTYDPSCVVDDAWRDFETFCKDAVSLPGWGSGVVLSRNYYGANCFSPLCSVWLSRSDNQLYDRMSPFVVDDVVYISEADAISFLGVSVWRQKSVSGVISHGSSKLVGKSVAAWSPPSGKLLRRAFVA